MARAVSVHPFAFASRSWITGAFALHQQKVSEGRMLIEPLAHLPASLGVFRDYVLAPTDPTVLIRTLLRWGHIVAAITWIGLLYYFNLVNVNFMKALDAPTKGKVVPELMPRALWFFRWGAVLTVLAGLTYYAMFILRVDVKNAETLSGVDLNGWVILLVWLAFPIVAF